MPPLGGRTQIRTYISFCAGGGGPPRREEDGAEACGEPAFREAGQELRHWSGGALFPCQLSPSSLKQCGGSGMFIPDPDFYPSRISDPGSKNSNKREG